MNNPTLIKLRSLIQDERLEALNNAQQSIIKTSGECPTREQYRSQTIGKYPILVTGVIICLCLLALLAAFTPSAIRLYYIGSRTFSYAIDHKLSTDLVGISVVLMAEVSQLVFSLSLATLGASKTSKMLLYGSMAIATAIALVGNIQVALPGHWTNPFAWLEAIAPPLLVLSLSYILKEQMLTAIEQHHANERIFQQALVEWNTAIAKPEKHPQWQQYYANALRDAIRKANKVKLNHLSELSVEDWRMLVSREMQSDSWYSVPDVREDKSLMQVDFVSSSINSDSPLPNEFKAEQESESNLVPLVKRVEEKKRKLD